MGANHGGPRNLEPPRSEILFCSSRACWGIALWGDEKNHCAFSISLFARVWCFGSRKKQLQKRIHKSERSGGTQPCIAGISSSGHGSLFPIAPRLARKPSQGSGSGKAKIVRMDTVTQWGGKAMTQQLELFDG